MADRYLTRDALDRALRAGRDVEHWLGARMDGDERVLKWLGIEHERDGSATLRVVEVLDAGSDGFIDVYEFTPYDWDAEDGKTYHFQSAQEALEHAIADWGADPDRFVNQGVVQLEYADYKKDHP